MLPLMKPMRKLRRCTNDGTIDMHWGPGEVDVLHSGLQN